MATSASPSNDTNCPEPNIPKLWRCDDPQEYVYCLPKNDGNPIGAIHKRMKQYDQGMCGAWQDEIEKLLIFAGLLSATLTAFTAESYKWLRQDNAATSANLLLQISNQLDVIINNTTSLPPSSVLSIQPQYSPDSQSVRINILWFLSLIMCLSTVILGILCLQWLREFTREVSLPLDDVVSIRQIRYQGLLNWKVPQLISALPVILQTSVVLFFAGILELLWSLHRTVAAVITVAVGLIAIALIVTATAPLFQIVLYIRRDIAATLCPYKSPISWVVLRFGMLAYRPVHSLFRFWHSMPKLTSWVDVDTFFHRRYGREIEGKQYNTKGLAQALEWMMSKFSPNLNQDVTHDIFHCLHSTLPRPVALQILLDWARDTGNKTVEGKLALGLDGYDPVSSRAQYDLLVAALLQRFSHSRDYWELLMELRLRCLNTIADRSILGTLYTEAAWNYYYRYKAHIRHLDGNRLQFQSFMTMLECYRRERDSPTTTNGYPVGRVLAQYIRHTPVREDNATMCFGIFKQLSVLIDEAYQYAEEWSTTPATGTEGWDPGSLALFLLDFDLRALEKWEMELQVILGVTTSVTARLVQFMENILLPTLENHKHLSHGLYMIT